MSSRASLAHRAAVRACVCACMCAAWLAVAGVKARVACAQVEGPTEERDAHLAPLPPPIVRHTDLHMRLQAPEGVDRWEPSGAAVRGGRLWVVSDKDGYLAAYALPLREGAQRPALSFKLSLPMPGRLKWEGLEVGPEGELLLLEAISRTVWRCEAPEEGCPKLTRLDSDLNPRLDSVAPMPFHYLMFEALARRGGAVWVGTRGLQARTAEGAEGGLWPWTAWAEVREEPLGALSSPAERGEEYSESQTRGLVMGRGGLLFARRAYGVSGAVYDEARGGLWLTLSAEREGEASRESVSGLLAFSRLSGSDPLQVATPLSVCARFDMKPEGVALGAGGAPIVVFDEDLDRKLGARRSGRSERFPLGGDEDYVWEVPMGVAEECLGR